MRRINIDKCCWIGVAEHFDIRLGGNAYSQISRVVYQKACNELDPDIRDHVVNMVVDCPACVVRDVQILVNNQIDDFNKTSQRFQQQNPAPQLDLAAPADSNDDVAQAQQKAVARQEELARRSGVVLQSTGTRQVATATQHNAAAGGQNIANRRMLAMQQHMLASQQDADERQNALGILGSNAFPAQVPAQRRMVPFSRQQALTPALASQNALGIGGGMANQNAITNSNALSRYYAATD
jgi:hypothetical protein